MSLLHRSFLIATALLHHSRFFAALNSRPDLSKIRLSQPEVVQKAWVAIVFYQVESLVHCRTFFPRRAPADILTVDKVRLHQRFLPGSSVQLLGGCLTQYQGTGTAHFQRPIVRRIRHGSDHRIGTLTRTAGIAYWSRRCGSILEYVADRVDQLA